MGAGCRERTEVASRPAPQSGRVRQTANGSFIPFPPTPSYLPNLLPTPDFEPLRFCDEDTPSRRKQNGAIARQHLKSLVLR